MAEDAACMGLAQVQGCEPTLQKVECLPQLARRVSPGGGVFLVEPQEELCGPRGYTPRGFTSLPGREEGMVANQNVVLILFPQVPKLYL